MPYNKSAWIKAIAEFQSVVLEDQDGAHRVIYYGTICTPEFNSAGAAQACLDMYMAGTRVPESQCRWFVRCTNHATGVTPHPVIGKVPTCDRCHKFATGEVRNA